MISVNLTYDQSRSLYILASLRQSEVEALIYTMQKSCIGDDYCLMKMYKQEHKELVILREKLLLADAQVSINP